jgi:hypothetical protein
MIDLDCHKHAPPGICPVKADARVVLEGEYLRKEGGRTCSQKEELKDYPDHQATAGWAIDLFAAGGTNATSQWISRPEYVCTARRFSKHQSMTANGCSRPMTLSFVSSGFSSKESPNSNAVKTAVWAYSRGVPRLT